MIQKTKSKYVESTIKSLAHTQCRTDVFGRTQYLCGYSGDACVWRYRIKHNATGTDFSAVTDINIAKNFCAGAN